MKIILTESQYNLLESMLMEVVTPLTKITKGGFIKVYSFEGGKETTSILNVTEVYDDKEWVQIRKSGASFTREPHQFFLNVNDSLDVDGNILKFLKGGKYVASTSQPHPVQSSIKDGEQVELNNVAAIQVLDSSKKVVDEIFTSLGEEKKSSGKDGDDEKELEAKLKRNAAREKEKKASQKRVFDMVMNSPDLKKAFYHQPTILKGLLNVGAAKGITPAMALVNKYLAGIEDKGGDKQPKEFLKNKSYQIKMLSNNISLDNPLFDSANNNMEEWKWDKGDVLELRMGHKYLESTKGKPKFFLKLKDKLGDNTYKGRVVVNFKNENSPFNVERENKDVTVEVIDS